MAVRELNLFIGLARTLNTIVRASDPILKRHQLTRGQFAVLEALYHKNRLSVGKVMELVLTTGGNIPVIVRNLEKQGLVTRLPDEEDRRRVLLTLTEEGRERIAAAFPENSEEIRRQLAVFSPAEQEQLIRLFKKFGGRHAKNS